MRTRRDQDETDRNASSDVQNTLKVPGREKGLEMTKRRGLMASRRVVLGVKMTLITWMESSGNSPESSV
jgi:hypothetical protein